ncbi:MAG: MFS transporter [Catenulispora sp.]|nr:MFS transporter [Catenulispora sp.]
MKNPKSQTKLPRSFHRIWAASAVSSLGDGIYGTALPLLAFSLTRSPLVLSLVTAAEVVPWVLFGLLGGALVDRWDRRTTMWIADLCRAAVLAVAIAGAAAGFLDLPLLVGLAFLLGVGQIGFDMAAMAYLPELLDRDPDAQLSANSRLQGTQQVTGSIIGPPLGGVLFAAGRAVPMVVDAVSFLFSSLMIRSLPRTPRKPAPASRGSLLAEAKAGLSYVVHDRLLIGLHLRGAIGNLGFGMVGAVFVVFARETLHLSPTAYGAVLTLEAVGGIAGSALGPRIGRKAGMGTALTLTAFVEAAGTLCQGLSRNVVEVAASLILFGAGFGATMVLVPSVRGAIVPDELMGRVGAAGRLISWGTFPLGAVLGGWFAEAAGLRAPFIICGTLLTGTSLVVGTMTNNRIVEARLAEAARLREVSTVGA